MHHFTVYYFSRKHIHPLWACILLILLLACPAGTAEPAYIKSKVAPPSEHELKAIYLYNFLKFVQWPQNACTVHDDPSHRIAVIGDSQFNQVLKDLQQKLNQKGHELQIIFHGPYRKDMDLSCCCLLFITATEQDNLPSILAQIAGQPVLTVADTDAFMDRGVMITLVSRNNKIRWAINRKPVAESGLKLNVKLLDIAVKVIDK
ncbi:MAG: YfiR family protein [Desulfobulbaceae bacterium]|nr:YfiR family protein [Desulfobulbaceae bacterium]